MFFAFDLKSRIFFLKYFENNVDLFFEIIIFRFIFVTFYNLRHFQQRCRFKLSKNFLTNQLKNSIIDIVFVN